MSVGQKRKRAGERLYEVQWECPTCFEQLGFWPGMVVCAMPCKPMAHLICAECVPKLTPLSNGDKTCPICRHRFTSVVPLAGLADIEADPVAATQMTLACATNKPAPLAPPRVRRTYLEPMLSEARRAERVRFACAQIDRALALQAVVTPQLVLATRIRVGADVTTPRSEVDLLFKREHMSLRAVRLDTIADDVLPLLRPMYSEFLISTVHGHRQSVRSRLGYLMFDLVYVGPRAAHLGPRPAQPAPQQAPQQAPRPAPQQAPRPAPQQAPQQEPRPAQPAPQPVQPAPGPVQQAPQQAPQPAPGPAQQTPGPARPPPQLPLVATRPPTPPDVAVQHLGTFIGEYLASGGAVAEQDMSDVSNHCATRATAARLNLALTRFLHTLRLPTHTEVTMPLLRRALLARSSTPQAPHPVVVQPAALVSLPHVVSLAQAEAARQEHSQRVLAQAAEEARARQEHNLRVLTQDVEEASERYRTNVERVIGVEIAFGQHPRDYQAVYNLMSDDEDE